MSSLKIAVAQINCIVGDLTGNAGRILDAAQRARDAGADLMVTPELALCGYPPEDLLLRPDFFRACDRELTALAAAAPLPLVVGHPVEQAGRRFNAASLIDAGRIVASYRKQRLPNTEVFDEERYFDAGDGPVSPSLSAEAEVYEALKLGVHDYLGKNGFPGALIGLSGGIDSALTLAIAVDALGAERVRAVMMPSPYTAQMSLDDSREMVRQLGVRYDEIPIAAAMDTYGAILQPLFADLPPTAWADTTPENIQARIRGMILMALSNRTGAIVLTTGNKSEMAVGYATLYGDMAGGFAVIKDVFKTFVYRLARYRNGLSVVIPENIIVRPPSAELKPGQTDQDTLPAYEVLDAIIEAYMERDLSPRQIVAEGLPEADVRRVVTMLKRNEYKRRQSPVGIRVTRRGFGKDWRYPITSRYADEW